MNDRAERKHIHVTGGGNGDAKIRLEPFLELAAVNGYTRREMNRIRSVAREHHETLIQRWIDECEGDQP